MRQTKKEKQIDVNDRVGDKERNENGIEMKERKSVDYFSGNEDVAECGRF